MRGVGGRVSHLNNGEGILKSTAPDYAKSYVRQTEGINIQPGLKAPQQEFRQNCLSSLFSALADAPNHIKVIVGVGVVFPPQPQDYIPI